MIGWIDAACRRVADRVAQQVKEHILGLARLLLNRLV